MKKYNIYLILLIFPIFLFITGYLIKEAGGPYYLNYYDPSYVYLVNSLNVMQFTGVGHTDHPGTTVQVIGAVVLKFIFLFTNSSHDIITRIFSDPEFYLGILNKILVIINCLTLYIMGIYIYKITKNLFLSLLIQLSPFVSFEIFYGLVIFSPENLLIFSGLCITALLYSYIYKIHAEKLPLIYIILFALVCGFGMVSKLNFIPICTIPLILIKGIKNKLKFIAFTIISFILFFLPAMNNLDYFIGWSKNLIFNTDVHGTLEASAFEPLKFLNNIISILVKDVLFSIVYATILITIIIAYILRHTETIKNHRTRKMFKVLFSILVAFTVHVLIVAKTYMPYAQYYMIPAFILIVPGLALSFNLLIEIIKIRWAAIKLQWIYGSAIVTILIFGIVLIANTISEAAAFRNESYKILDFIKNNYQNESIVPAISVAGQDCAFAVTTMYGYGGGLNTKNEEILSKMLTSTIFYDIWKNNFFTIPKNSDIKQKLLEKNKVILQLNPLWTSPDKVIALIENACDINNLSYVKVFSNLNGESVYEVKLK